jgi:type IX secretion system PorP/SprF family membrane protein
MKRIKLLIAFSLLNLAVFAQQQLMVTHYMYNGLVLNPAYAGVHEGISTSFLLREQWVGFPGAPSTQLVSIHSPLTHRPVSLGAVIFSDKLGVTSEVGGYFSYAYRINLNEKLKLSMGLQASIHNYKVNYAEDNGLSDPGDNLNNISELKWNFGTGFLLHTDRLYLGFSIPQFLNKKLDLDDSDGTFSRLVRHYYVSAGYAFDVGPNLVVKPNFLIKAVPNAPIQVDLNANILIKEKLWMGVSYRSLCGWLDCFTD